MPGFSRQSIILPVLLLMRSWEAILLRYGVLYIVDGRDTLKLGLIKKIWNGETTNMWLDIWIPRDYKLRAISPITMNPPQKVSDLIEHTMATWNIAKLHELFLVVDKEEILNIPLSL